MCLPLSLPSLSPFPIAFTFLLTCAIYFDLSVCLCVCVCLCMRVRVWLCCHAYKCKDKEFIFLALQLSLNIWCSYIYAQIHIRFFFSSFCFFLVFSFCLLTAEIDLTHHKVAAFVMLVACYFVALSPVSLALLLMALCCCLLDFNILAANKYEIQNTKYAAKFKLKCSVTKRTLTSQSAGRAHKLHTCRIQIQ